MKCRIRLSAILAAAGMAGAWQTSAIAQECDDPRVKGKLSRNYYRLPYAPATTVRVEGGDYVSHCGAMDLSGPEPPAAPVLVAAADGWVTWVEDGHNGCGFPPAGSTTAPCPNFVVLQHAHGESSSYFHLRQYSARNNGISCGMFVAAGTILGIEGDVGISGGDDGAPRPGTCFTVVPPGTGQCEGHVHFSVWRGQADADLPPPDGCCFIEGIPPDCARTPAFGERINPLFCDVFGSILEEDGVYTAGTCSPNGCLANRQIGGTYAGYGTFEVTQAGATITADDLVVTTSAAVVLHAGARVRLLPGTRAAATSYFRAEIGLCDQTAPAVGP